jgi:hypothetical protein
MLEIAHLYMPIIILKISNVKNCQSLAIKVFRLLEKLSYLQLQDNIQFS